MAIHVEIFYANEIYVCIPNQPLIGVRKFLDWPFTHSPRSHFCVFTLSPDIVWVCCSSVRRCDWLDLIACIRRDHRKSLRMFSFTSDDSIISASWWKWIQLISKFVGKSTFLSFKTTTNEYGKQGLSKYIHIHSTIMKHFD